MSAGAIFEFTATFIDGPKDGETADFAVPAEKGHPLRIKVIEFIKPEVAEDFDPREGIYEQSGLSSGLYVWKGWL